jgi:hypothetical protein
MSFGKMALLVLYKLKADLHHTINVCLKLSHCKQLTTWVVLCKSSTQLAYVLVHMYRRASCYRSICTDKFVVSPYQDVFTRILLVPSSVVTQVWHKLLSLCYKVDDCNILVIYKLFQQDYLYRLLVTSWYKLVVIN